MKQLHSKNLEEKASGLLDKTFEYLIQNIPEPQKDEASIVDNHFIGIKEQLIVLKSLVQDRHGLVINGLDTSIHDKKIRDVELFLKDGLYNLKSDLLLADSIYFIKLESLFELLRTNN